MVLLNDTNKNNSILLEVLASVFTVSSYFCGQPSYMTQIHKTTFKTRFNIIIVISVEFLSFWIGSIRTYAKGSIQGFPKIVLIGTHRDKLPVSKYFAEWLSSWLAEQEDRGSIPRLATWIFRDWLFPASKSRYGWKIAKSRLIKKQPTNQPSKYFARQKRFNWRFFTPSVLRHSILGIIKQIHYIFFTIIHFEKDH